jgi:restriction system protein
MEPTNLPKLEDFDLTEQEVEEIDELRKKYTNKFNYVAFSIICLAYFGTTFYLWSQSGDLAISNLFSYLATVFIVLSPLWLTLIFIASLTFIFKTIIFKYRHKKYFKYMDEQKKYDKWYKKSQGEYWRSLSGSKFKTELAELLSRMGFRKEVIADTGAKGVDMILKKDNKKFIVRCFTEKKPIGRSVIRELYKTMIASKYDEALLASTSGFTRTARKFSREKRIELLSLAKIISIQKSMGRIIRTY